MSAQLRRDAYLEALGIDRWAPRSEASPLVSPGLPSVPTATGEWSTIEQAVSSCTRCSLHRGRTRTVFGTGDRHAEWMVVGEAPGAEEDRQGEPFVGAAGQLLTAMLAAIELPRQSVFIANVLKCRPPENRDPKPEEVSECLPYLHRQVALVRPKIILAFGRVAAQNLLGSDKPLAQLRGVAHAFGSSGVPVVVTYHPAYLLRSPGEKRKAWEDLKFARRVFAEHASGAH